MSPTILITIFLLSALACLLLKTFAPRWGLMDHPDSGRKKHSRPVPLVGGLAIWMSFTTAFLLQWAPISSQLWMALTAMGLIGLLDDLWEVRASSKLLLQVGVAGVLWWGGIKITLFIPYPIVSLLFTVLWFTWAVNAYNYLDHAHGLCGGVTLLTLLGIAKFQFLSSADPSLAETAIALAAAILGFLVFNYPRGAIFLGDCGSHLLGAAVATLLMQITFAHTEQNQSPWAILAAPFFILVPATDFLQVTIRRWQQGRPIWKGDTQHLAHLFIKRGLSAPLSVLTLWILTTLGILLGIWIWRMTIQNQ